MNSLNPQKVAAAVSYIDTWLDLNFRNSHRVGMQVAIQHGDKLVYSKAFGKAKLDPSEDLTIDHLFRIASHSKPFTATAIMQLAEEHKLHLNQTVSEHLPWFTSSKDDRVAQVTIRQLLNHTAGLIRDGLDADFWILEKEFPHKSDLKAYISESRLIIDGDTRFKYSNVGYAVLGLLIEAASGQSYRDYMTQHIITALKLKSTGPDLDSTAQQQLASGYGLELLGRPRVLHPHVATNDMQAATGFYSNAEDVCRFFSAHFFGNTTLISDTSKREMQHGYWDTSNNGGQYGLGLATFPRTGWTINGHGGGFPGFITNTQFDAKRQLVVSVLTNNGDFGAADTCKKMISIIDIFQQDTDHLTLPVKDVKRFEGRFFSHWGAVDIVAVGKKLFAVYPLGWSDFSTAESLEVIDDATLRITHAEGYGAPNENIEYTFDSAGHVKHIRIAGVTHLLFDDAVAKGWI